MNEENINPPQNSQNNTTPKVDENPQVNKTGETPLVKESKEPEFKPRNGFPVKTLLLIIFLAIIAGGLIGFAFYIKPKPPQDTTPITEATPTLDNPVQTILTISSTPISDSTSSSSFSTDVVINTGQDAVNKVQLEISYNPNLLTSVDITPGAFFINPQILLKTVDQKNGRVTFALGVQNGELGVVGQGILAKITFKTLNKNANVNITLLPKSEVTADGYPGSVLKSVVNASFSASLIPTVIPSITPTPSGPRVYTF